MLGAASRRLAALARRYGDSALAAALSVFAVVDVWTNSWITASKPLLMLFSLGATVPLAWRSRAPVSVALVVSFSLLLQVAIVPTPHPPDVPFAAWVITAYSVGAHAPRRAGLAALAVLVAAVDTWVSLSPNDGGTDLVFISLILVGFWSAGRVVGSRNALAAALAERTRELEAERDERARLAVAEERTRIARELHDIVAHTLSVIVVQAGAERLAQVPGTARDTLESIERTGRGALAEMGRLLGILRSQGDDPGLEPQPTLARLDDLLHGVRAAGLRVDLEVEGTPRALPVGMDVSAYRIVQEALTNCLKHGRCSRARVTLRWSPALLEIDVSDDGVGPGSEPPAPGHGLLGLRERASLFGGSLVTGRSELGGFLLAARLPLQAA